MTENLSIVRSREVRPNVILVDEEEPDEIIEFQTNIVAPAPRPTGRSNMTSFRPEPTDLYGLVAKYPKNDELLSDILIPLANKGLIPHAYGKKKEGKETLRKPQLVSRVLAIKASRKLALDWLKEHGYVDKNSKLSDFYLRFRENGKTYPADIEDSEDVQLEAGVPIFSKGVRNTTRPTLSKMDQAIMDAVETEPGSGIKDPVRETLIIDLLKDLSLLDDVTLEGYVLELNDRINAKKSSV